MFYPKNINVRCPNDQRMLQINSINPAIYSKQYRKYLHLKERPIKTYCTKYSNYSEKETKVLFCILF